MTYDNGLENILLTGATGVMGGRLLQELLSTTKATVYCLVRAADMAEAMGKVETSSSAMTRNAVSKGSRRPHRACSRRCFQIASRPATAGMA